MHPTTPHPHTTPTQGALLLALLVAASALVGFSPAPAQALETRLLAESAREFDRPHDVSLSADGTLLYVADLGNDRVAVLDATTLKVVGTIGADELDSPHDVTVVEEGDAYLLLVADSGNDRVVGYLLEGRGGKRLMELKGGLSSPEGVVVANGRTYVTSTGSGELVMFDAAIASRSTAAGRLGGFSRPHDVGLGPDGLLYVVDSGNNRIQVVGTDMKVRTILGGKGFDFNDPKYLDFTQDGWLFVADEYNHVVKVFDAKRQQVGRVPAPGSGLKLNKPEGVQVRGDRLWVVDTYNNRILLFSWKR